MKKFSSAILLSTSALAFYGYTATERMGLNGELSLLAGYTSSESNFNTDAPIKTGALNSAGVSNEEALILPLGELRYRFGTHADHTLYLGTSRADIIQGNAALEIGYKYGLGDRSSLSLSFLPTIMKKETWADPFLVNEVREISEESGNAYRFQYDNILSSGFNVDLGYYDKQLDDERSASLYSESEASQLDREGYGLYSKLSWTGYAGPGTFIQPAIRRNLFHADGKAQSYTLWGYSLTLIHRAKPHSWALTVDYALSDYDAQHPIFALLQENEKKGATLAYQYSGLMGYPSLGANLLFTYSDTDSNITFYEENSLFVATGLTLTF